MNTKLCPVCKFENAENALICVKCGNMFLGTTPPDSQTVTLQTTLPALTTETEHEILLFVMEDSQPITLKNQTEIILGRKILGEEPPTVDLTAYGQNQLGVSRRHAAIEYQNDGYVLRDLGSSNGTTLNDTPLIPHRTYHLQSGDRMRLGQLAITVYFKETKPTETTFYLRCPELGAHMTIADLSTKIMPILNAIAEIKRLTDAILERTSDEIGIQFMRVDETGNYVRIQTDKPVDVVQVIHDVVTPWRENTYTTRPESLGVAYASKVKADLAPEVRKVHAEKLLPPLQTLAASDVEVMAKRAEQS
ncbi:MAG: FHA domain-containing protein [Anaerolineae bacterium]|nr:FHA domain-containing protein [Anaerolineae bacterium]